MLCCHVLVVMCWGLKLSSESVLRCVRLASVSHINCIPFTAERKGGGGRGRAREGT